MAYDANLKASITAAAGGVNSAVSAVNSAAVVLGPLPATGLTFNVHLGLNSGDMVNRVATASIYLTDRSGGTMYLAGAVQFPSGAATTSVRAHKSVVISKDLLSQVSGAVPEEIAYRVTLTDAVSLPCNAVNYKCDIYPAVGTGFSFP